MDDNTLIKILGAKKCVQGPKGWWGWCRTHYSTWPDTSTTCCPIMSWHLNGADLALQRVLPIITDLIEQLQDAEGDNQEALWAFADRAEARLREVTGDE